MIAYANGNLFNLFQFGITVLRKSTYLGHLARSDAKTRSPTHSIWKPSSEAEYSNSRYVPVILELRNWKWNCTRNEKRYARSICVLKMQLLTYLWRVCEQYQYRREVFCWQLNHLNVSRVLIKILLPDWPEWSGITMTKVLLNLRILDFVIRCSSVNKPLRSQHFKTPSLASLTWLMNLTTELRSCAISKWNDNKVN